MKRPSRSRACTIGMLVVALTIGACGSPTPPPSGTAAAGAAGTTQAPDPTATPDPRQTAAAPSTTKPASSPAPTVAPSPTLPPTPAAVVTTHDEPVWTIDKALTLQGTAGTTTWQRVMFAARTVSLRWKATPADDAGCKFAYSLESSTLKKPAKGTDKASTAKAATGKRNVLIKYGDGELTVKTDCATWSMKIVPTGHPGVVIKRDTRTDKTTATAATALNDALAEATTDWWLNTSYRYVGSSRPRVISKKVTVDITYELPKWTAPDGTDPALVEEWKTAMAGMKHHTQGEAAIAVQAAGRYLASLTKTRFSSMRAMKDYFDTKGDKALDKAQDRLQAYNELTFWGASQGAFLD